MEAGGSLEGMARSVAVEGRADAAAGSLEAAEREEVGMAVAALMAAQMVVPTAVAVAAVARAAVHRSAQM